MVSCHQDGKNAASANLLSTWCPFTKHQMYREIHGALEASSYKVTNLVKDLLRAWFPVISSSSLVEDVFANMADTIKRSSKRETASLAGLQAAAVRATMQKCRSGDEADRVQGVELTSIDHEGLEVRGLRSGIWRPDSAPSCHCMAIVRVEIRSVDMYQSCMLLTANVGVPCVLPWE